MHTPRVLVLLVTLLLPLPSRCVEYFVAPWGSDANPGTSAEPFATPARGADAAQAPGDVVTLRGGDYTVAVTASFAASGAPGSPITCRSYPGETAILRAVDGSTDLIEIQGSHVVLERLTLKDGQTGIRVEPNFDAQNRVIASANDILIDGCTITGSKGWAGIDIDAGGGTAFGVARGRGITVRGCTLQGNGQTDHHHGIYINAGDDVLIEGCDVSGNAGWGLHFWADKQVPGYEDIVVAGSGAIVRGNRLHGNGVVGPGGSGVVFGDGDNPLLGPDEEWRDVTIENNLAWGNREFGIQIDFGAPQGTHVTNAVLRNNSCFDNGVAQITVGLSENVTVANNLLSRGPAGAALVSLALEAAAPAIDATFYDLPDGPYFVFDGGAMSFAAWQGMGFDPSGVLGSAAFVDPAAPDLHLSAQSEAIDRGTATPGWFAATDIDGDPRPLGAALDMGADEAGGGAAPGTSDILASPGPDPSAPPRVLAFDAASRPIAAIDITPYGAGGYGANVGRARLSGLAGDGIVTGPGPGAVYGPQVRAFTSVSQPLAKINFYAYGTLRFGVSATGADVDGDGIAEILTAAGPGYVFGPHVRGFSYDGTQVAPIAALSFFAYGTLKYGVNAEGGDVDGDGFYDVVTGPGPSAAFGAQIRAFAAGPPLAALPGATFFAYPSSSFGACPGSGDLDGDGMAELLAGRGPGPALLTEIRGFAYDGSAVAQVPGVWFEAFPGALYGASPDGGELDGDPSGEILAARGPDPAGNARARGFDVSGTVTPLPSVDVTPFGSTYGLRAATALLGP